MAKIPHNIPHDNMINRMLKAKASIKHIAKASNPPISTAFPIFLRILAGIVLHLLCGEKAYHSKI